HGCAGPASIEPLFWLIDVSSLAIRAIRQVTNEILNIPVLAVVVCKTCKYRNDIWVGAIMFACGGNESETLGMVAGVPVETGLDWVTVSGAHVGIEQYNGLSLGSKLGNEPGRRVGAAPDDVQHKILESRGLSLGDLVIQFRPVINSI